MKCKNRKGIEGSIRAHLHLKLRHLMTVYDIMVKLADIQHINVVTP